VGRKGAFCRHLNILDQKENSAVQHGHMGKQLSNPDLFDLWMGWGPKNQRVFAQPGLRTTDQRNMTIKNTLNLILEKYTHQSEKYSTK
jgi:hypothetical protein